MVKTLVTAFFLALAFQSFSQKLPIPVIDAKGQLVTRASLPKHIKEASGLEITSTGLWTHNDDRFPILYKLDTLGNVTGTVQLNHPNNGWEDLAQDSNGNFYIGAFGNNKNDRKDLKIYKLQNPDSIKEKVCQAEIIRFQYNDQHRFPPPPNHQNFDADALIAFRDSLYIFTKNRTEPFTGYTKIYRLPQYAGSFNAIAYDSIFLGQGSILENCVTSADVSPDGKMLALLSHSAIWLVTNFRKSKFSSGKLVRINLSHLSHKAGVCFASTNKLYIVDELEFGVLGGKIYVLDLSKLKLNLL